MNDTLKPVAGDKAEMRARLLEWFPKGSTVYTVARNASFAKVSIVAVLPDGTLRHPNYAVASLLGLSVQMVSGHDCIGLRGYVHPGNLVEAIASELYGNEAALKHESL